MRSASIRTVDERYAKAVLPLVFYKGVASMEHVDGKWSTYILNGKRLIKVKKGTITRGKWVFSWRFPFPLEEQNFLDEQDRSKSVHLVLICDSTICSLTWRMAKQLMPDYGNGKTQELRVTKNKKADEYKVTGSNLGQRVDLTSSGLADLWHELCA